MIDKNSLLWRDICEDQIAKLVYYIESNYALSPSIGTPLYQYTRLEALVDGILGAGRESGKEIVLRASAMAYLNDFRELETGNELSTFILQNVSSEQMFDDSTINQLKKNIFITCFSRTRDSLPMWSMYGNDGHGVALVFDASSLSKAYTNRLYDCIYDSGDNVLRILNDWIETKEEVLTAYKTLLPQGMSMEQYARILLMIISKDKAFEYESEVRALLPIDHDVKYRTGNGFIIPYVEFALPKESLHEIIIGPCNHQTMVKESVEVYLASIGMGDVYVSTSLVPYKSSRSI